MMRIRPDILTLEYPAERLNRGIAIIRKNCLFAGNEAGGQRLAILYSFAATCKANGICFRKWLEDVLPRLNSTPSGQIDSLIPAAKQSCQWAQAHYYEERMPSGAQTPDGITFSCSNLFKTLSPIFSFTMGLTGHTHCESRKSRRKSNQAE